MTMLPMDLPVKADFCSPLARLLHRAARWQEQRHERARMRLWLADVPDHLRRDIGLDGGAPLQAPRRAGRTFIRNEHPDAAPGDWRW